MSRRNEGRVLQLPPHRLLAAAAGLGEAIAKLREQHRMDDGPRGDPGGVYGTDVGELLGCIAGALDSLGFETEASAGGFGRPPTLVVKDGKGFNRFLRPRPEEG